MNDFTPTALELEIYAEMELTPEMVKSIRTLCGVCLRHFVEYRPFVFPARCFHSKFSYV